MGPPLEAIDVHAHYGVSRDQPCARVGRWMSADAAEVLRRARRVHVAITVVSPLAGLMTHTAAGVERANRDAARVAAAHHALRQWVIVDPRSRRTFDQAAELLRAPWCVGIKIHPELHGYPIREHGRALFAFAERHGAVVLTHSGQERSLPADFVPLANAFPGVRLILGHLGFCIDGDPTRQVRAIQRCRHGNLYTDTSSAKSIIPRLLEWAVREVGAERILFGSDTPLYFLANQRARVDAADLPAAAKRRILRDNAVRLLGLAPPHDH